MCAASSRSLLKGRNTQAVKKAGDTAAAANGVTDVIFGLPDHMLRVIELPLDQIIANPNQPRKCFPEEAISDLASSIESIGLKQPIGVIPLGDREYQLVFGERRLRAHHHLNRLTITATIVTGDPKMAALVENTQRSDLNAIDLAFALQDAMETLQCTQQELGRIAGLNRAIVSRLLKIVELPQSIINEFRVRASASQDQEISRTTMMEIAAAETPAEQLRLWEAAKAGSQSRVIEAVRKGRAGESAPTDPTDNPITLIRLAVTKAFGRLERDIGTLTKHSETLTIEDRARLETLRAKIETALSASP
ncbi:MAG: ParB/RepB/Spo0J family partition protein [Rhodospirillaceae bacterium]